MAKNNRKIIVVANQKGGVAKTTTALVLQSMYQMAGFKTLMIDLEIQGNNTHVHNAQVDNIATAYDVFVDNKEIGHPERTTINEAIQHTEYGDIVPNDPLLTSADALLNANVNGNYVIVDALEELEGYDIVIIDTAPALNRLLTASLVAATHVIIPINKDKFSLEGLSQLNKTINDVKKRANPNLKIEGILMTRIGKKSNFAKTIENDTNKIAEILNTKVFKTGIRECVKLQESQACKVSLFEYDKKCTTAVDYMEVFKELEGIDLREIKVC